MTGKRFGYARVSTHSQSDDRQVDQLHAAGIAADDVFSDVVSGTKASRPALDALLAQLREGDSVTLVALDRLGRSTGQLLAWVEELEARGVALVILNLAVDTRTPAGRLLLTLVAAIAAMERETLVERTLDGLAAARVRGRVGGAQPRTNAAQRAEIRRLYTVGRPTGELAELFGVSPRTIRRIVASEETR